MLGPALRMLGAALQLLLGGAGGRLSCAARPQMPYLTLKSTAA